jgi:hypothetical protein
MSDHLPPAEYEQLGDSEASLRAKHIALCIAAAVLVVAVGVWW